LFHAAGRRYLIEHRDGWKGAVTSRRAEYHLLRVTAPANHIVGSGVIGQADRRSTGRRNDKDVVIAIAVRRECDPASVRRESRVDLTGAVVGDSLNAGAVLVGGPDVSEVAECDAAGVIIRMARKFDRSGR